MEQQEEKKIKVYTRRSKSSSSLPLDLASEILLRLPEKSVVRFRSVSKAWSSITTDPYFINLFKARSPRVLLCFQANNKLFVSSIPQHHQTFETSNKSYSSSLHIDRYHMEFPKYSLSYPTESVQGLICFQESATPIVWNPSTRQVLALPKPFESSYNLAIFLGYDPVESKHKVMCIPFGRSCDHECRVLTLGSAQESWRTVKTNFDTRPVYHTSRTCIKGVIYYLASVGTKNVLISFDVRSEKFDKIQRPSHVRDKLLAYQGRLACVDKNKKLNIKNGVRLWILEDAEKHKWSSKDFLSPYNHFDKSLETYFLLKGFTHTGEFIYVVEDMFYKSSSILFCDPVRNSYRRFEIITEDKFIRELHDFPNHVESQVSL